MDPIDKPADSGQNFISIAIPKLKEASKRQFGNGDEFADTQCPMAKQFASQVARISSKTKILGVASKKDKSKKKRSKSNSPSSTAPLLRDGIPTKPR